ncbi:MAG: FAD-binding oxidoreductase [Solirubrobacteraceae bacterium]
MTTTALPITATAWNLHADQRPADILIARCVADVQAAIADARSRGLKVAPQSTGHYAGALPALGDALLLRLAFDEPVVVDPGARVARIPAGAVWDDVVAAAAPHGLAAMHGSSPTVSAIGYLLGGGLSFYGRAHGLAVNHVRRFELVTPDGEFRVADARENPDLFWALRGGGGGYGVVTAVELALLPYAEVTGGALLFPAPFASAVLQAWGDWAVGAPETITSTWRFMKPPGQDPFVIVDGVALDPAAAAGMEAALRAAATPFAGGFGPMPAAAVARLHGDPEDPTPGISDGILLEQLDRQAMADLLGVVEGSPLLFAELRQIGGALSSPPEDAGARGHLEGRFVLFGLGAPGVTGTAEAIAEHLVALTGTLERVATGTRFASLSERWGSLRTCVPDAAFERLAALRGEVDPEGLLVAPHVA